LKFNTDALAYFDRSSPDFGINGSIIQLPHRFIVWLRRILARDRHVGFKQGCLPKLASRFDRCDLNVCPPRNFVAMAVQIAMMFPAQWNSEFIADLASECSGLRKFEMMRITR
jgi:hypothetical protein